MNPFDDPASPPGCSNVATVASRGGLAATNDTITPNRSFAAGSGNDVFNDRSSPLTPPKRLVVAGTPGTPSRGARINSITPEQADYLRSRPDNWEPTVTEQRDLVRYKPRPHRHHRRQPWVPTPHPLYGTSEMARYESPHLYHLPHHGIVGLVVNERQRISRHYLVVCGFLPFLLPFFYFGYLDWVMRKRSRGKYRKFCDEHKRYAVLLLLGWFVIFVAFTPIVVVVKTNDR